MPSPQKTKGKSYENAVAKFLTEAYGEKFMRVGTSGAYLGGANFGRREEMTDGQIRAHKGDICPPDDWNYFNCETKWYKEFKFHLLYDESKILDDWIQEVVTTANDQDINLIIMKFNRIGEYVAYEQHEGFQVDRYTVYKNGWCVTSLKSFWTPHNMDIVKHRSINGRP